MQVLEPMKYSARSEGEGTCCVAIAGQDLHPEPIRTSRPAAAAPAWVGERGGGREGAAARGFQEATDGET